MLRTILCTVDLLKAIEFAITIRWSEESCEALLAWDSKKTTGKNCTCQKLFQSHPGLGNLEGMVSMTTTVCYCLCCLCGKVMDEAREHSSTKDIFSDLNEIRLRQAYSCWHPDIIRERKGHLTELLAAAAQPLCCSSDTSEGDTTHSKTHTPAERGLPA